MARSAKQIAAQRKAALASARKRRGTGKKRPAARQPAARRGVSKKKIAGAAVAVAAVGGAGYAAHRIHKNNKKQNQRLRQGLNSKRYNTAALRAQAVNKSKPKSYKSKSKAKVERINGAIPMPRGKSKPSPRKRSGESAASRQARQTLTRNKRRNQSYRRQLNKQRVINNRKARHAALGQLGVKPKTKRQRKARRK